MLASCNGLSSFERYTEISRFETTGALAHMEEVLASVVTEHELRLNRDPDPRRVGIGQDYIATILRGRCMILVEGTGSRASMRLVVTLNVVAGSECHEKMRQTYAAAERALRHR